MKEATVTGVPGGMPRGEGPRMALRSASLFSLRASLRSCGSSSSSEGLKPSPPSPSSPASSLADCMSSNIERCARLCSPSQSRTADAVCMTHSEPSDAAASDAASALS